MEETIKEFLTARLLIEFGEDVTPDSDLFELGLLDSQTYIELIRFLESRFDLRLTDEQILSNVLVSLSGIVSLVSEALANRV